MEMLANVNGICVTFKCCNKLKLNYTVTIFKCKKSSEAKRKNVLFTKELFHISWSIKGTFCDGCNVEENWVYLPCSL